MRSLFGLGAMVLAACAPVDFDDDHATPSAPPAPPDRGEPGTRPPSTPSVDAPAGPRGTVVGGLSFSCVWREDGEARCWGSNESGQLGAAPDGIEHPVAASIPGLGPVAQIAAGDAHVCALHTDGGVSCWGSNEYAELGHAASLTGLPRRVPGVDDAVRIAAGITTTCAVRADSTLWCWGGGTAEPKPIAGLGGIVDAALGLQHGCSLDAAGAVVCWSTKDAAATPVVGLPPARSLTARLHLSCAVTIDDAVYCWEPGDPAQQVDPGPVRSAAASYDTVCALDEHRRLRCHGDDADLGSAGPFQSVGAGARHVCALHEDGVGVFCDGPNGFGETTTQTLPPVSSFAP